ncbi:MAG: CvpA family protein [Patescibacteria group bacterium]
MVLIDFIFLIILGGFILFGLWFGLIHTLGALIGTVLGVYLSSRWYDDVAIWAQSHFAGSLNVWKVICFILLFVIINRLVGLLFYILEKMFNVITSLPFLKSINRLAGAILGLIEGAVVIGGLVFISNKFPFGLEEKLFAASTLKGYFLHVFNILLPLVPQALKAADDLIKTTK